MDNANSTATASTIRQQQQHFQLHEQLQQQQKQQQQQPPQQQQQEQHEHHQQQFCLRWHNHQTSLLSTLPILLDQSHLTDVTISAEGRTLRAHRVVLSACSTFFLELFRALDASNHPIVILPGASFAAIVALLTFMYSGEVNVYEEQIPVLLNLAETLGVKGLADVQNNKSTGFKSRPTMMESFCKNPDDCSTFDAQTHSVQKIQSTAAATSTPTPPIPTPPPPPTPTTTPVPSSASAAAAAAASHSMQASQSQSLTNFDMLPPPQIQYPFTNPLLAGKFPSHLENLFLKSLQFYPNLLPQPLNFSQTALNKTTELLAKYQQQCNLYQGALNTLACVGGECSSVAAAAAASSTATATATLSSPSHKTFDDPISMKRFCSGDKVQAASNYAAAATYKDLKRIDKIADSLRGCGIAGRQQTICNENSGHAAILSQHSTQPEPFTSTSTNSNSGGCCTISSKASPVYSSSKAAAAAATTVAANQSPQQQQAAASVFEISIEEQATRHLQHQIEQIASLSRGGGVGGGDVSSFASNSYDNSNNNINSNCNSGKASGQQRTSTSLTHVTNKPATVLALPTSPGANAAQGKTPSNSKLYATCFICHKQLSNQYNLRVHLETHQNVRYACNVCSHVSRSKDALRKHVSYRHPGAPSPCETEARRKRASKILLANSSGGSNSAATSNMTVVVSSPPQAAAAATASSATSSLNSTAMIGATTADTSNATNNNNNSSDAQMAAAAAAAHLNSAAAYMFLPNQFHLAAAAAAVVHQQQQQQQQQPPSSPQNIQAFPSTPIANSPLASALEMDTTLSGVSPPGPIKLEQHSPSSTEAISSPPTPQQALNPDPFIGIGIGSRETDVPPSLLQRSSPA